MKVILDKEGCRELIVPEEYKRLTEYFSTDIQSVGGEYELTLLQQFQQSGIDYQEIGVGNAFLLIFKKDAVTIENMFTNELLPDIPMDLYEACLTAWIQINNDNDERTHQ